MYSFPNGPPWLFLLCIEMIPNRDKLIKMVKAHIFRTSPGIYHQQFGPQPLEGYKTANQPVQFTFNYFIYNQKKQLPHTTTRLTSPNKEEIKTLQPKNVITRCIHTSSLPPDQQLEGGSPPPAINTTLTQQVLDLHANLHSLPSACLGGRRSWSTWESSLEPAELCRISCLVLFLIAQMCKFFWGSRIAP